MNATIPFPAPEATVARDDDEDLVIAESAGLALFALSLGIAGTVLGVTVVWFFAAIPLGLAAVVVGAMALTRNRRGRYRSRSVIAIALGFVALLLGTVSAVMLPVVMDRADRALTNARDDVVAQIDKVDTSLAGDVDRLNGTISQEMRELERSNHRELAQLESTSDAAMRRFERRMAAAEKNLPAQQRSDLARLAKQLRAELGAVNTSLHKDGTTTLATFDAMAARIAALETALGLTAAPPVASPPVVDPTIAEPPPVNGTPVFEPASDASVGGPP